MEVLVYLDKPIKDVCTADIRAYVALIGDTQAPAMQRRNVAAIKSLFRYLNETGYCDDDPAATLRNTHPEPPRNPVALSEQTVMQLLDTAPNERDYVIIALAYYGALRGSELSGLIWGDVLDNRLRVRDSPAPRVVILPAHLVKRLTQLRGTQQLNAPVLASRTGEPMAVRSIDRVVQMAGERLHLKIGGLNVLRNTHAKHALAHGASLTDVQIALGHSTPRSTIRHARSLTKDNAMTAAMLPAPPASSRKPATPKPATPKRAAAQTAVRRIATRNGPTAKALAETGPSEPVAPSILAEKHSPSRSGSRPTRH